jgi:hypothetical protein
MDMARKLLIAIIILGGLSFSFAAEDKGGSLPELPAAIRGEQCVEPIEVMRRDHMTMLFHQRDRTVFQGERSTPHSLVGCLSCHTQKDSQGAYIPINAPGQFCESCHSYASVKIDCFGCHANRPLNE